jgi:hypothetical protein
MLLTLLAHLFVAERHRPRASTVGFSRPYLSEIDVEDRSIEPLLATNSQGKFLNTHVSKLGYARFGYTECTPDDEGKILVELHKALAQLYVCASDAKSGLDLMRGGGVTPRVVVSDTGEDVDGVVGVRCQEFPKGCALIIAPAEGAGLYTRIGSSVGVLAKRVDKCFVAVQP